MALRNQPALEKLALYFSMNAKLSLIFLIYTLSCDIKQRKELDIL